MAADITKVEHLLKRPDVKTVVTSMEHEVQSELFHTLQKTIKVLESKNIKSTLNYIVDNELLNDYGVFGGLRNTTRNPACGMSYSRGSVLSISFGTHNIGSELSYSHMGVVIADLDNYVVVVPVTTNRRQVYTSDVSKTVIHVSGVFRKDSTLLVHQIRSVHKNRIKSDLGFSIVGTSAWEEVEKKIASKYALGVVEYYKLVISREKRKLKKSLKALQKQYNEDIEAKNSEIAMLKERLAEAVTNFESKEVAAGDNMNLE